MSLGEFLLFSLTTTVATATVVVMNTTARALRFRCTACDHRFISDSLPTGPEGCPECGALRFEELSPPRSPLPCPHCTEGERLSADGTEVIGCLECGGTEEARCTSCCLPGSRAIFEDGDLLVCAACVRETVDAESRSAEAVAGAALLLFAMRYPQYEAEARDSTPAERLSGEFVYLAVTRAPEIVRCSFVVDEKTHSVTECTADHGSPCKICSFADLSEPDPEPRKCITPPPPAYLPELPPLRRADPESSTWRALRATSVETVRPGAVS